MEKKLDSQKETTKNHYLMTIKRIINFTKLYRKAEKNNDGDKMKFIECKLKEMNCYSVCKQLSTKNYNELIHHYESQIRVINYIEKEGFISPEFKNVGLTYEEISNACIILLNKGILKQRNCTGLAYEFNI